MRNPPYLMANIVGKGQTQVFLTLSDRGGGVYVASRGPDSLLDVATTQCVVSSILQKTPDAGTSLHVGAFSFSYCKLLGQQWCGVKLC